MEIKVRAEERSAEFVLDGACTSCDGTLNIRVTPTSARAYCATCHTLSHPDVVFDRQSIRIAQPLSVLA